jgi:hypothetical protein
MFGPVIAIAGAVGDAFGGSIAGIHTSVEMPRIACRVMLLLAVPFQSKELARTDIGRG